MRKNRVESERLEFSHFGLRNRGSRPKCQILSISGNFGLTETFAKVR